MTLTGQADAEGIRRCNAELIADPRFRAGMLVLIDADDLDTGTIDDAQIESATGAVAERDWAFPPRAIAIVAAEPSVVEVLRQWRAHLGGSKSHRRLFTTRPEALDWLAEQRDAGVQRAG